MDQHMDQLKSEIITAYLGSMYCFRFNEGSQLIFERKATGLTLKPGEDHGICQGDRAADLAWPVFPKG